MRVRFVHLSKDIDVSAAMKCPRKVEDRLEWLKAARKAIPEIPIVVASNWGIKHYIATTNNVIFELSNGIDVHTKSYDYCHVLIDRKASSLGG